MWFKVSQALLGHTSPQKRAPVHMSSVESRHLGWSCPGMWAAVALLTVTLLAVVTLLFWLYIVSVFEILQILCSFKKCIISLKFGTQKGKNRKSYCWNRDPHTSVFKSCNLCRFVFRRFPLWRLWQPKKAVHSDPRLKVLWLEIVRGLHVSI